MFSVHLTPLKNLGHWPSTWRFTSWRNTLINQGQSIRTCCFLQNYPFTFNGKKRTKRTRKISLIMSFPYNWHIPACYWQYNILLFICSSNHTNPLLRLNWTRGHLWRVQVPSARRKGSTSPRVNWRWVAPYLTCNNILIFAADDASTGSYW